MRVQILHVPDCPSTVLLSARLLQALDGRRGVHIEERVVRDERDALSAGMTGSPTLLIDGHDPFAASGQEPSLSCRLYADDAGALSGAPTLEQLRGVLTVTGEATEGRDEA